MGKTDELYRQCRWCRNFRNGRCVIANEIFEIPRIKEEIELAIDDGCLSEAVRETILSHKERLAYAETDEEIDSVIGEIIGEIEWAVKHLEFDQEEGLEIIDPSTNEHYCKRFE